MRPVRTLLEWEAEAAEANVHLSPPASGLRTVASAAPPPSKCDAHTCPWWPYSSSKEFKANTAMIIVILFSALACALAFNAAVRYFLRRSRRRGSPEESQPKRPVLPPEEAEEELVPTMVYSPDMKLAGAAAECTICLSEFADGERIRVLTSCGHGFHVNCIQTWLAKHSSCPTCRTNCSSQTPSSSSNKTTSTNLLQGNGAETENLTHQ